MSKRKGYDPFAADPVKKASGPSAQTTTADPMEDLLTATETSPDSTWSSQDAAWTPDENDENKAEDPTSSTADLESLIQDDGGRVEPTGTPASRGDRTEPKPKSWLRSILDALVRLMTGSRG
jgi:hypothetical protein